MEKNSSTKKFLDENNRSNSSSRQQPYPGSRSSPSLERMDYDEPGASNRLPNENQPAYKQVRQSIVRRNFAGDDDDDDDENENDYGRFPRTRSPQLFNRDLMHPKAEASALNLDADAAYALQLQQEEYSRDSMTPFPNVYRSFRIEGDGDTASAPIYVPIDQSLLMDDAVLAAQLQQQEERQRARNRPPYQTVRPVRQPRPADPSSSHASERDEPEVIPLPFPFSPHGQFLYENDDSDEGFTPERFFRMMAHARGHRGFHSFFPGRRYNRSGNLQDTEDDFGPEDYERLLQLDDTVHKKKLTQKQIDSIPTTTFMTSADKSDEKNKCGICLDQFEDKQKLRQFECSHLYHKECADRWLKENNACPICRVPPVHVAPTSNGSRHNSRGRIPMDRSNHSHRNPTNRNVPGSRHQPANQRRPS